MIIGTVAERSKASHCKCDIPCRKVRILPVPQNKNNQGASMPNKKPESWTSMSENIIEHFNDHPGHFFSVENLTLMAMQKANLNIQEFVDFKKYVSKWIQENSSNDDSTKLFFKQRGKNRGIGLWEHRSQEPKQSKQLVEQPIDPDDTVEVQVDPNKKWWE